MFIKLLPVLVSIALLLQGCAGIKYSDQPTVAEAVSGSDIKATTVLARASADEWRNSGAKVVRGAMYAIRAKGRWRFGGICHWCGPDGVGCNDFPCLESGGVHVPGYPHGTLIARVGEKGTPFVVGDETRFTADEDGVLYFNMNGDTMTRGDNEGVAQVEIEALAAAVVSAPPPQSAPEAAPPQVNPSLVVGQRWAVIVGLSSYADTRIPGLRYAARDAQCFYDWTVSPNGGGFAPSRVRLLIDKQATGSNIRESLFGWLSQALEEDVVTIYFASHGSPQSPDRPQNLFLLPYDTDYDRISSTAFPMWDIETALKRFIRARRVVVIADACHSGGVGQSFDVDRRANRSVEVNPISEGLQNLAQAGQGVAVITASDANQFSQEGQQWGGGHGVFTHFLLKGLEGEADYNADSRVTLGELIPYLSEQVRRETKNAQSPTVAGKFDPALSMAR